MTAITKTVRINAPKSKVWAILADLAAVKDYNPSVTEAYYTSTQREGVGASRHCDLRQGEVDERITAWQEGESYTIEIYDGKPLPPSKEPVQATIELTAAGSETLVQMTMSYEMKYGVVGNLMNRTMMEPQFTKLLDRLMGGLKHFAETGESVQKGFRLETAVA